MLLDTVGNVMASAMVQSGAVVTQLPADPVAAAAGGNAICQQMLFLLRDLGRDLWRKRQWSHMQKEYTFVTAAGVPNYPLPADFGRMVDQTGWNRTNRLPLGGPLSGQEWQYLKARLVGVVFTVLFREALQEMYIYPGDLAPAWKQGTRYTAGQRVTANGNVYSCTTAGTSAAVGTGPAGTGGAVNDNGVIWSFVQSALATPAGYTVAYEYMSRYTVQPATERVPTTDVIATSSDTMWFDPLLLTRGLILYWKRAKGLSTASAEEAYKETLAAVADDDFVAPTLRLDKHGWSDPLIGDQSIPLTGFGGH